MNPTYQQAMAQALMGQNTMPAFDTGQNPQSGYGQAFLTGNQAMPQQSGMFGASAPTQQQQMQQMAMQRMQAGY